MGSSSSAQSLASADTFFSSNDKPFFVLYPEEQILSQKFNPSKKEIEFFQDKKNFPFSSQIIVDFLLNSQMLTHEKSQFEVFKNILIPSFSQALCTGDSNMIYSKLHFSFSQSLFQFFADKNKEFTENIVFNSDNDQNKIINDIYLSMKNNLEKYEFASIQQFAELFKKTIEKSKKFRFKFSSILHFSSNLIPIVENILSSNAKVPNFCQFLVDSLFWTLNTNELYLTLKIFQNLLIGLMKENPNLTVKKLKTCKIIYNQKFQSLGFQIKRYLLNSYINLDNDTNPFVLSSYSGSILGATPFFLFAVNNNLDLLRIKISNKNVSDNNERFFTAQLKSIFNKGYFLTCANNVIIAIDRNKNDLIHLCNPDPFWVKSTPAKVTNSKNSQIKAPIASDGKYLYSLFSSDKIDIYQVDIENNIICFIKRIELDKSDKSRLKEPYDKEIIPKKFIENATMITNGVTVSFIFIENPNYSENNQSVEHIIRSFSLLDGKHIEDYLFSSPFPINSMSYEPYSRCLWSISPHNNGACFIKFDYTGPDPLWFTSLLSFETLIIQQKQCSMQKAPKDLANFVDFFCDYLYASFIPFMGTDLYSFDNGNSFIFAFFYANFIFNDDIDNSQKSLNLILNLFTLINNENFHQFLLLLLNFQLKIKGKINKDTSRLLYKLFYKFLSTKNASSYYQQLLMIFINLYDNLSKHYCSKFFNLFIKDITNSSWISIFSRLENSKKYPFLFDIKKNCAIISIIDKICINILKEHTPEFEFLLSYQSSLFHCFSLIFQKNPKKLSKIESNCLLYISSTFQSCCMFLKKNLKISTFESTEKNKKEETPLLECNYHKLTESNFLILFRKLLILIQLAIPSASFSKHFLQINLVLLNFLVNNYQNYFQVISQSQLYLDPFYMFYRQIFYLHSICLKQITSFPKTIFLAKYEQFLNIKMNKSALTLNDIFLNKIDEKAFTEIIEVLYKKVMNPLNKKLTQDDKEFEKLITLALVHQTRAQKNFIEIHEKIIEGDLSAVVITPEIRQIIQAVYKIRSNLRSKKQKEDQQEYNKLKRIIDEKCNFLLKYNSSDSQKEYENQAIQTQNIENQNIENQNIENQNIEDQKIEDQKIEDQNIENKNPENKNLENKNENLVTKELNISLLKNISDFLNNDLEISDVIDAQEKFCDVKENLLMFFRFANDVYNLDLPNEFLYMFLMIFSESSEFLNSYEMLSKFTMIQHDDALALVHNVLRKMENIPPNTVISFICFVLMMISYTMNNQNFTKENHRVLFDTFSLSIIQLCNASKTLENPKSFFSGKVIKASISFFSYFHRLFLDKGIYSITFDENTFISTPFQFIHLKNSFSFILAHSIFHGGFMGYLSNEYQAETDPLNLINFVTEPKFHGYSLLLFEKMFTLAKINQQAFLENLNKIMNNIGSVFCGSSSDLLKISPSISDLPVSQNSQFCKTPSAQIAAALELIQLIRRLLLSRNHSSDSNASKLISDYFIYLNNNLNLNDQNHMKQIFAMLVIMSNVIDIVRPSTIVTTAENKTYFVLKMDERNDELLGLLLPFNSPQLIIHKLSLSATLKSNELIPFSLSSFSEVLEIPFSLFKKAIKMTEMTKYSDCLFTFFALRCVRENILDPEKGLEFSMTLLDIIKERFSNESHNCSVLKDFVFRNNAPIIFNLLKKSLTVPESEGIFVGSPIKPKFFHTSYTQLVFQKDFKLTENIMEAKTGAHVFISSILDDSSAVYFAVKICEKKGSLYQPIKVNFGITTFAVDQNQSISITYSSIDNSFYINGASCYQNPENLPSNNKDKTKNLLLECRYLPSKNKIAFALSSLPSRLFSCKLPPSTRCSFIALVYPNTKVSYECTFSPQTDCFQKNLHLYQIVTPLKFIKRIGTSLMKSPGKNKNLANDNTKKFSMLTQRSADDERDEIVKYSNAIMEAGKNKTDIVSMSNNNTSEINPNLIDFAILNISKTAFSFSTFHDSSYVSNYPNVYSSPLKLRNFIVVSEVSGQFDIIPSQLTLADSENIIPPFHFDNYFHIPTELINCYFSGVCEMHRKEILTLLLAKNFSSSLSSKLNSSTCKPAVTESVSITLTLQTFSIVPKMIVDFVVSVLFLLEPIKITNLLENKSPIDFDSFNGFENCSKMDFYDYFSGLTKILNYINKNQEQMEEFIYNWSCKINASFENKYMHFVNQTNSSVIISDLIEINASDIYNNKQDFVRERADGWITIPLTFGLRNFPTSIKMNKMVFPQNLSDSATYAYSTGEMLRIYRNSEHSQQFAFLPFYSNSNESLFNSFFELVVSFKYFVLFLYKQNQVNSTNGNKNKYNMNNVKDGENHSLVIRSYVFDSIIAGSPFFFTHSDSVLNFLNSRMPAKFTPEYISRLNMFIAAAKNIKNEYIQQFILEQTSLFDDMKSLIYKYFIDNSIKPPLLDNSKNNNMYKIELPKCNIPKDIYESNMNLLSFLIPLSRVLIYNNNPNQNEIDKSFPFHLVLNEWSEAFMTYPPCDIQFLQSNIISITFLSYLPNSFQLIDRDIVEDIPILVSFVDSEFKNHFFKANINSISTKGMSKLPTNKVFIKFMIENMRQHNLIVFNGNYNDSKENALIAYQYREVFKKDIYEEWLKKFTNRDDQMILMKIDPEIFQRNKISTRLQPNFISSLDTESRRPHLIYMRAIYLITFNYVCCKNPSLLTDQKNHLIATLQQFISLSFSIKEFRNFVHLNCQRYQHYGKAYLNIDRQIGNEVRNGINKNLSKSMIAQFSYFHLNNKKQFISEIAPFHIKYNNENGIDCGGLMRDFVSELIKDINSPKIGLFVKTPNANNHEGKYQDAIIPVPDPSMSPSQSSNYYQSIGALIAIGIRHNICQPDLIFPPVFWNFMVDHNSLKINDIFEIDLVYNNQIINLLENKKSMTDQQFEEYSANVVILNSRGNVIYSSNKNHKASNNVMSHKITKENCERFVNLCNEARITELKHPLEMIRFGFWENISGNVNKNNKNNQAVQIPRYVTPQLLEFIICGERLIDITMLKNLVKFSNCPSVQQKYFWESVGQMTNEQRKKLLQFSTGLPTINQKEGLNIDCTNGKCDSRLPSASTCFYRLHLPLYSSSEKMFRALIYAMYESGTFEHS